MLEELTRLRVFVASPGDVKAERDRVSQVIDDLNKGVVANKLGLLLQILDWRNLPPEMGRPQQVILDQLPPETWHVFVGILWSRFGTPPGATRPEIGEPYLSGTEEEFHSAYRLWKKNQEEGKDRPRILFYRCMRPIPANTDPDQLKLVQKFFAEFETVGAHPGLYQTYVTDEDLAWRLRDDLEQVLYEVSEKKLAEMPEEQKRATQLELISGITQKIASILDSDELLHQVAHLIGDTFGYYNTSIHLVEADSNELILRASAGPFEALVDRLRLKIGQEGISGWVARSGEPLLVNDVTRELRYCLIEESKDTRSELAVPIKRKEEIIGVLDVQSVEFDAFGRDDVSFLQTLADQLAIAIENARLYQQTDEILQARVKERSALYAIAEMVNQSDLDVVLQVALDSAIGVTGMDSGGILLLDPSTGELFLRAHRVGSPEFLQAFSHAKADEGLMPRMLNSVLIIDNLSEVTKDRRVAIEKEGFQSLVSIPLKAQDSPLGVIVIASHSPRTLTSEELELLITIGNQMGVAAERANLQAQELKAAILEERQHMARQMHDDIAQTLGYLGLQVDSVMGSSSLGRNAEVQAELEGMRKAIEDVYERVRRSIMRLGEDAPDHFYLGTALSEIISEFEKQTGCKVESRVDEGQLLRLPPSVAFQATYIIREALTNIRKHSGADSVHLTLQGLEAGMIEITIQDNGRGFDLDSEGRGGFGLRFMRERAERVGGSLRIETQPGQGTRVIVSLPSD